MNHFDNKKIYVGVFCATDEQIPELYKNQAFELGKSLYKAGYGLVTGGANTGLMNAVINGFSLDGDCQYLKGVIPDLFKEHNVHHFKIPEKNLIWTENIYQRLQDFQNICHVMIVLPGGIGTLHELLDFMVPKQWGLTNKKIILFNTDNYWDYQLLQFKIMVERKALKQRHLDLLTVVTNVSECMEVLTIEEVPHQGLNDRFWNESQP